MKVYDEKEFEERKAKLENKMTKAFYKGQDKKFEAYRMRFRKLFHQSYIYANLPEGQQYTIHVEFPDEDTEDPIKLEVNMGRLYTREEYDEELRQRELEKENQELNDIFGLDKK